MPILRHCNAFVINFTAVVSCVVLNSNLKRFTILRERGGGQRERETEKKAHPTVGCSFEQGLLSHCGIEARLTDVVSDAVTTYVTDGLTYSLRFRGSANISSRVSVTEAITSVGSPQRARDESDIGMASSFSCRAKMLKRTAPPPRSKLKRIITDRNANLPQRGHPRINIEEDVERKINFKSDFLSHVTLKGDDGRGAKGVVYTIYGVERYSEMPVYRHKQRRSTCGTMDCGVLQLASTGMAAISLLSFAPRSRRSIRRLERPGSALDVGVDDELWGFAFEMNHRCCYCSRPAALTTAAEMRPLSKHKLLLSSRRATQ
ncbi:hypothetical protein EVAR_16719_1 [Eumeta japonica]|uniref:Uncharacterized protein n=1 Tax=Eumeta variegata TaxID=151549 RepID=A0A4C1V4H1_EUMVA|nr:hypothetical protein EVAR_16719_1 [Eumeta japonica]